MHFKIAKYLIYKSMNATHEKLIWCNQSLKYLLNFNLYWNKKKCSKKTLHHISHNQLYKTGWADKWTWTFLTDQSSSKTSLINACQNLIVLLHILDFSLNNPKKYIWVKIITLIQFRSYLHAQSLQMKKMKAIFMKAK